MVLAPLAIVAFWGSSYMLDCIRTIESPGVPIEICLHTDAGDLTLAAASYSISPMRGTVYVTRPKLMGPGGGILAQLDTLEVSGIRLMGGGSQALKIRGSNLSCRVERKSNGKFDFEAFIPSHGGSPSEISFDVDINRAHIEFVDQGPEGPWNTVIDSPRVAVAGLGQDWTASGRFIASGVGGVDLDIHNSTQAGFTVSGSTESAQLASVGSHFLQSPLLSKIGTLRQATATSLVASGPFRVHVPHDAPPTVQANVSVTGVGLKWEKFSAQQAQFKGEITELGVKGDLTLLDGKTTAAFTGSTTWKHGFAAAGRTTLAAPSTSALPAWIRAFVPAAAQFQNGTFVGWLSYHSAASYHVSGEITATNAGHDQLSVSGIRAKLEAQGRRVVVELEDGQLAQKPITGIFEIDPLEKRVKGTLTAEKVDLASLGGKVGFHQAAGDAQVVVIISGTIQKPRFEFQSSGQGIASFPGDHTISLGHFDVSGAYDTGNITLDRALFNTPEGVVQAHGGMKPSGEVNATLVARGILAAAYDPRFSGSINATATLSGTLKNPYVSGRLEGYDLMYGTKTVPAIVSDFKADRTQLELDNLEAARGTASLEGFGNLQFKDKSLHVSAAVRDVQLAEWLGDAFVGSVDIPSVEVSGTLAHPLATANVEGSSVVVDGVKIDTVSASVSATEKSILLNHAVFLGADGKTSASGSYDIERAFGSVQMNVEGLSVERILPSFTDAVFAHGTVNGSGSVSIRNGRIADGSASGNLKSIAVNGTPIGDGIWDLRSASSVFHGQISLGDSERYIHVTKASYDPDRNRAAADVAVKNIQATNFLDSASNMLSSLSAESRDMLDSFDGSISLDTHIEGTVQDPTVQTKSLQLSNLTFRKVPIGEFNSAFELNHHRWTIANASLSKGPALVSIHGTVDAKGEMHLDGTNDNRFDLGQLSALDARFSRLTGTANLWFTADGPIQSPKVVASLNFDNLFAPPGLAPTVEHDDRYLRVGFDRIVLDPTSAGGEGAHVTGVYFYKGFQGSITADAPFEYPFTIPEKKALSAEVTFDPSDLKAIAQLLGGIDGSRTSGTARGNLKVTGTADALSVGGGVTLNAEALAFTGVDDILKNADATLSIKDSGIQFTAGGTPIRGGSIAAALSIPFNSLQEIVAIVQKGGAVSLLDRPISGEVNSTAAQFRQRVMSQSLVAGTANTEIKISGTVKRPAVTGSVTLGNGDVVLKVVPEPEKIPSELAIDPEFNVDLRLSDPARLRSSTADMYLSGSGKLSGRIQRPKATADLVVEKGTVRLPASLLRLEQGGTVNFTYGVNGNGSAAAIVDMEGSTSVTATRFADTDVQRYDITLGFKGDLLQDNGLTLTATSDPGDLSQERILAILGQVDLLTTLSNGGKESSAIQNAMLSRVPSLLDPYTGQVARGLGLDFLNVEYNSYDFASIAFGKILGSGFSIEGSRQLSEPPAGFQTRYDYRLIYRPKRLFGALSRIRFYVGSDQDRPWKLGLEYGVRF